MKYQLLPLYVPHDDDVDDDATYNGIERGLQLPNEPPRPRRHANEWAP